MTDISVEELKERLGKGETINILDVREQGEYYEFNLKGKLIPLGEIPSAIDDLEEWKNQEIVVHCKRGGRSAAAKDYLSKNGFTQVRNLLGGADEWLAKFGGE